MIVGDATRIRISLPAPALPQLPALNYGVSRTIMAAAENVRRAIAPLVHRMNEVQAVLRRLAAGVIRAVAPVTAVLAVVRNAGRRVIRALAPRSPQVSLIYERVRLPRVAPPVTTTASPPTVRLLRDFVQPHAPNHAAFHVN